MGQGINFDGENTGQGQKNLHLSADEIRTFVQNFISQMNGIQLTEGTIRPEDEITKQGLEVIDQIVSMVMMILNGIVSATDGFGYRTGSLGDVHTFGELQNQVTAAFTGKH